MKKEWLVLVLIIILSFSVFATDFFTEYENYNNLYEAYQTNVYNTFSNVDECIIVNHYEDDCFKDLEQYKESSLPLKKNNLIEIRNNIISLKEEYVSEGGTAGDNFYDQLDQLQSNIGLLNLEIDDEIEVIESFVDMKTKEHFENEFVEKESEYVILQTQLHEADSESEFGSVQSKIETLQSEINTLESEVEEYSSTSDADFSDLQNGLDTLTESIQSAVSETYGNTSAESYESISEISGFTFSEESISEDLSDLLKEYLNKETSDVISGSTDSASDLELLLALLKELKSVNQEIDTQKQTETDPVKIAELETMEDKNDFLYAKITGLIDEEYGDDQVYDSDLVKISSQQEKVQKDAPKGIKDLLAFLVMGIVLLGVLYMVFRHRD